MSVSIGNKNISQIFIGDKEVQSIYIGNTSIYENYKFQWNFTENGATLVKYTSGTRTNVKIPSKIGHDGVLYDVIAIGNNAFANTNITSVTTPDSVTSIGNSAFSGCTSLTSITIPDSVTSIGGSAFSGCSSLASVYYTGDIASWCGISFGYYGANPLEYAHNLYINDELVEEITIPNTITEIKNFAFCGCTSLTSITIPNSVISIGIDALRYCTNLTSITIGSGVTNIGSYAFDGCASLAIITYSGRLLQWDSIRKGASWNTNTGDYVVICTDASIDKQGVKYTLYNDEYEVTGYSWWPTSISIKAAIGGNSVTSIGNNAFYGCSSLTSVTIPGSVTSIGNYAFQNCQSLTSVTIPDSVMSIGSNAFYGCPIETASIPAIACSSIKNSSLETVIITSGTSIGDYAFYGCSSLTSITIPDSVTSIGVGVFHNCSNLTSITIPNSVTSIGDGVFQGCSNLTSVNIPDGVTSVGDGVFYDCSSLTSVTIPDSVTSIGNVAFSGCSSLTSITIPDSVMSIGDGAFSGCSSLTSVTYQGTMSQWNSITKGTYWDNGTGNYIVICTVDSKALDKQGVTYEFSNNEYEVTSYNGSGSYVDIRPLITTYSVTSISASVFANKTSLTKVGIPSSISTIGTSALSGCIGLQEIIYSGTLSQWERISKDVDWDYNTGDYVLVCSGSGIALDKQGITYTLTQGAYHASSYSGSEVSVSIKGVINGINVTTINPELFMGNTTITRVTIPGNVQTIGESSFQGCINLTTVNLNEGTQVIGSGAFAGCDALSRISISGTQLNTLPSTMSSIGSYAFSQCGVLTKLAIPSGVRIIPEGMMWGCTNFSYISLPNTINSIGALAFNATLLETIQYAGTVDSWATITKGNDWDYQTNQYTIICTDGYIRINGVIYKPTTGSLYVSGYIGTSAYVEVESSVDDISVISVGERAFDGKNIGTIILPSTITSVGANAFRNCPIIYAEIPTIAISSIPDSVLQTVVINDGTSIESSAFQNCTSLTSVTIPDSVMSIGNYAFSGCSGLTSVFYNGNIVSWCGITFYGVTSNPLQYAHNLYIDNIQITEITIPDTVTEIKASAFCGWNGTNITIPDSVTSIGNYAFYGCTYLTTITYNGTLSQWNGITKGTNWDNGTGDYVVICTDAPIDKYGVTYTLSNNEYEVTGYTGSPTSISVRSTIGGKNVTSIGQSVFYNCSSLTSVTIPDSVTSIGNNAFYGCPIETASIPATASSSIKNSNLKTVIITSGTSIIASAFSDCTSLTSVTIPNSVTIIRNYAFNNCSNLTSVYYTGDIASWCGISFGTSTSNPLQYAHNLYINNTLVTEITIPDTVTRIKIYAFYSWNGTSITIPYSVTGIGDSAFFNCSNLTSITFGEDSQLTSIGNYAFQNCSNLTSITFGGTKAQWGAISKGNSWSFNTGSYTIHCTDGDISK